METKYFWIIFASFIYISLNFYAMIWSAKNGFGKVTNWQFIFNLFFMAPIAAISWIVAKYEFIRGE